MRTLWFEKIATSLAIASRSWAQFAQFSPNDDSSQGISYTVNVPDSTASSNRGPIYFQMTAPKGTQWLGLGQGSEMAGANIFIMWSASDTNVTVSPRSGEGNFLPPQNPNSRITVLEGSGISPEGVMTANVRCDSCLDWGSGSMDPTNPSSSWIWSVHRGDPINSDNQTQPLTQHQEMGSFKLNLPDGTGGSSSNPFISASANGSGPVAVNPSSPSSSGSASSSGEVSLAKRRAHATLMSLSFIFLFPLNALTLYLRASHKVAYIHAPLQLLTLALTIAGFGLGVSMARELHKTASYHPVIGYIVVSILILYQPALGALQHLRFRRVKSQTQTWTLLGLAHKWLGRTMIVLGIINGGLGFRLTGPVGSRYVPRYAVILYSVVAGVVGLLYAAVVIFNLGRTSGKERIVSERAPREEKGYSGLKDERGGNGNGTGAGGGAYAMNTLANGRRAS